MDTMVSVSGGQSSAYIAANYPSQHLVFALVTVQDPSVKLSDELLRQRVSDRIGKEFIGTTEDDTIIHTILDLEQYLGRPIQWVAGKPFDQIRKNSLPNQQWRYCTTLLKIDPMFRYWKREIQEPVKTLIGFRAGEERRATAMMEKANEDGLVSYGKTPWQKPAFPLIDQGIRKDHIQAFWSGKNVRFAPLNNCVGCFHRNPLLLRKMFEEHPEKMAWFEKREEQTGYQWKKEISYEQIRKHNLQHELSFDDFTDCDSGYCGL